MMTLTCSTRQADEPHDMHAYGLLSSAHSPVDTATTVQKLTQERPRSATALESYSRIMPLSAKEKRTLGVDGIHTAQLDTIISIKRGVSALDVVQRCF